MSNFSCDKCKVDILEGPDGHYVTGCEHYPIEPRGKDLGPQKQPHSLNQVRAQAKLLRNLFGLFKDNAIDVAKGRDNE
jgi:hypothetical protein